MENSEFVRSLIHAEFNTTSKNENTEKAYFCCRCGGESLTQNEKETEHEGHPVIRAIKNSGYYSYKKDDIDKYLENKIDVSGVCAYKSNSTKNEVYFLKTRVKDTSGKSGDHIGKQGHCPNCGWAFKSKPTGIMYCSLLCKFESQSQSRGGVVSEQQHDDVGVSSRKQNDKPVFRGTIKKWEDVAVTRLAEENKNLKKKMSYRKKSRKGIPRRAPFF